MNRLTDKGLLTKKEFLGAYLYKSSVSKKDYPSGYHLPIEEVAKVMIIVRPN